MTRREMLPVGIILSQVFIYMLVGALAVLAADKTIVVVEKSTDSKDSTSHEYNIKNLPAGAVAVEVSSVEDMVDKVLSKLGPNDCLKDLHLRGHGASGVQGVGDGINYHAGKHINGNGAAWWSQLRRLKGKFCAGATIHLWGCHVGACDNGAKKLKELADSLGVTVKGAVNIVTAGEQNSYTGPIQVATPNAPRPECIKPDEEKAKKKKKGNCSKEGDGVLRYGWGALDGLPYNQPGPDHADVHAGQVLTYHLGPCNAPISWLPPGCKGTDTLCIGSDPRFLDRHDSHLC